MASEEYHAALKREQAELREQFKLALTKYFYDDAVEEFIAQNIDSVLKPPSQALTPVI